ncbi:MAG: 4'-phosphopantetheinyl transferase superfamily protein [Clostridia bacterium]|nr:4'-phosphopantetheinyl transferase superfamily protein [Clostridia bacterium]
MKHPVYVYISEVKKCSTALPSYIDEKKITNEKALSEKHTAYALLYKAAKEAFDIDMDISKLTGSENRKPVYPGLHFSLSHSKGLCAVALSKDNVGIDIEQEITGERAKRIRKNILHENESPDTDLTELWTKKEAIFKLLGGKVFIPSDIDTTMYNTESKKVNFGDREYTVTIATDNKTEIIWK